MGKITDECGHKPIFEALEQRLLLDGMLDEDVFTDGGLTPAAAVQVEMGTAPGDPQDADGIGESLGDIPLNAMQVSGNITTNTIWDAAGSPYEVTGHLTIYNNATLTIEPGVVVRVAPDVSIQVEGNQGQP